MVFRKRGDILINLKKEFKLEPQVFDVDKIKPFRGKTISRKQIGRDLKTRASKTANKILNNPRTSPIQKERARKMLVRFG